MGLFLMNLPHKRLNSFISVSEKDSRVLINEICFVPFSRIVIYFITFQS